MPARKIREMRADDEGDALSAGHPASRAREQRAAADAGYAACFRTTS